MEEVFDFSVRGKQNMGARNFVRQALLDKSLIYNEGSLPIKAMVRLSEYEEKLLKNIMWGPHW